MRTAIRILRGTWPARADDGGRMRSGPAAVSLVLAAAAVALGGLVAAGASAAPTASKPAIAFVSPSPAEGATLTTNAASFAFTYNRTPKQTRRLPARSRGRRPRRGRATPGGVRDRRR